MTDPRETYDEHVIEWRMSKTLSGELAALYRAIRDMLDALPHCLRASRHKEQRHMGCEQMSELQQWWVRWWWRFTPRAYRAHMKMRLWRAAFSWQDKGFQREAEIIWEQADQIPR